MFLICFEQAGTGNDGDSFNKILEISDMGPISTRRHEWEFGKHEETKELLTV